MKLIPYLELNLQTKLNESEFFEKVDNLPKKEGKFTNFIPLPDELIGNRQENRFTLYRNTSYKNSFKPIAFGTFKNSCLSIKFRMHRVVCIFMSFWLLMTAVICLLNLAYSDDFDLFSITMVFSGYFMMQYFFWREIPPLKEQIELLLENN